MKAKWKVITEFCGLALIAGSLVFLGIQVQQDRRLAIAELNSVVIASSIASFGSAAESDAFLRAYSKKFATKAWDTEGFAPEEVAALEMFALGRWGYFELAHDLYRDGLMSEVAWAEMVNEIKIFGIGDPMYRAVFDEFIIEEKSEFSRWVEELRELPGHR